jgi:lipoprotein-anchoring transpeptidase ErfK/SrfK
MPDHMVKFFLVLAVSAALPMTVSAQAIAPQPLDTSRFQPADLGTLSSSVPSSPASAPPAEAIYGTAPLGAPVEVAPIEAIPQGPATVVQKPAVPMLSADELVMQANAATFTTVPVRGDSPDPLVVKLQVLLDRVHASPGVIDGFYGDNVAKAIAAAEIMSGLPADGVLDAELWSVLQTSAAAPVLSTYVLTAEDVNGPFVPSMPADYGEMAQLQKLAYRDPAEGLAEKFHMDELFLRRLNPGNSFTEPGTSIVVANTGSAAKVKVAQLVADKTVRQLRGYDVSGRLVVAYPATIGNTSSPSPTGLHAIKNIADNAEYWYRPDVNFKQGDNTKALRLAPGPNNPIGAAWIGLDRPTYGIHGTPEPSKIDKTGSHGCVRLTNWDVRELVKLVASGVTVDFIESGEMASAATGPVR